MNRRTFVRSLPMLAATPFVRSIDSGHTLSSRWEAYAGANPPNDNPLRSLTRDEEFDAEAVDWSGRTFRYKRAMVIPIVR